MKYRIYVLLIALLSVNFAHAQNPRTILDKASETYAQSGGITANFSLDTEDTRNKITYSQDGKAYMKGDKFKIDALDGLTWFDGKTQWVYVKDTDEVNISNPTGEELQSISPSAMFNIYKVGFDLKYIGEYVVNGRTVLEIELLPQKKIKQGSEIVKIKVQIDKLTNIFSKITISDKSGYNSTVSIRDIKTKIELSDDMFRFDKSKYPDAEIVDLR